MSDTSNSEYYVPRYLDAPPRVLFMEMDMFMVLFSPIVLGMLMNQVFGGVILGVACAIIVRKAKAGRGRGLVTQAVYWYLPASIVKTSAIPPSEQREFVG